MYQCVKFRINRLKIDNFIFPKKTLLFLTSRDQKTVSLTSKNSDIPERAIAMEHVPTNWKFIC